MSESPKKDNGRPRLSDQELANAVPRVRGGSQVKVGLFVMVGLISFVVVLFLMTDPATLRGRYIIVTTVDNAGGVRRGDPVEMRGVIIGRINGFEMMDNDRVAIAMELEGEWKVPQGSRTRLGAAGLFGGRTMEVIPSNDVDFLAEGDTISGGEGGAGLMGAAADLTVQAGTVMSRIEMLLDTATIASVQGSASDFEVFLKELSGALAEQRATLLNLTESLSRSAQGLEAASAAGPDAARAIARADSAMAVLTATSRNMDKASVALQSVLERMERGEGTLGRLSRDESLYTNLNTAALSMSSLLADLQANPSKYINLSIF